MTKTRKQRKARLQRGLDRRAKIGRWAQLSDILKGVYSQPSAYTIAYHGARKLGGKFKRRYNTACRVREYHPHPMAAMLGL